MNKYLLFLLLLLSACNKPLVKPVVDAGERTFRSNYYIDFTGPVRDQFEVIMSVNNLTAENDTFNFAAVYPGSYSLKNFGRFVQNFAAFDAAGAEVATEKVNVNQWWLSEPARIARIEYTILETWDHPKVVQRIAEMGGSAFEPDFTFINGPSVFGYIKGLRDDPLRIHLRHPADWERGSDLDLVLAEDDRSDFIAESFADLSDAPLLLGELDYHAEEILGTNVYLYVYSRTGEIAARPVFDIAKKVLLSAAEFMNGLPAREYSFLFMFGQKSAGALEHPGSSAYVIRELSLERLEMYLRDVMAHEYFHIVTPLSVRSTPIDDFDFQRAQPTQHLWFFEGVTEWASHMMQLRSGLKSQTEFFTRSLRQMILQEMIRPAPKSLQEISLNSYETPENFRHIYTQGALTALLLDIRILELSGGKKGLREVIEQLRQAYNRERPFAEDAFFQRIVDLTFPEVQTFIDDFIIGNKPLPFKEYLAKIATDYLPVYEAEEARSEAGIYLAIRENQVKILWLDADMQSSGIQRGDVLKQFNDLEITIANFQDFYQLISDMQIGKSYTLLVDREGEEIQLNCKTIPFRVRHAFQPMENASEAAQALKAAWLRNLP